MDFEAYEASDDPSTTILMIIIVSVIGVIVLGLMVFFCVRYFRHKRRLTITQEDISRRNNPILENQDNQAMGLHVANLPGQNVNFNNLSYSNNLYQGEPQGHSIENQGYNNPSQPALSIGVLNLPGQNGNYNNLSNSNNPYQGQPQGYGIENQGYNYPIQPALSIGGSSFSMKNGPNRDYDYHFKKMEYIVGENRFVNDRCLVCLFDFEQRDPIRKVMACKHFFHRECLKMWLNKDRSCPFCRQDLRWEAIENKKYDHNVSNFQNLLKKKKTFNFGD
jgi:hypothetical protein